MAISASSVTPPTTPPRGSRSAPSSPKTSPRLLADSARRRSSHPGTPLRSLADVAVLVRKLRSPALSHDLVVCSSGPEPISHPSIVAPDTGTSPQINKADTEVTHTENFVCADAVDASLLLRAARTALLDRVKLCGADALLDERWTCRIRGPRHGTYRVHVEYSARPARTGRPDPGRPVALSEAHGVPGLMTILERA